MLYRVGSAFLDRGGQQSAARLFPGRKFRTLCLPMWLGVCIGRLSSFIAAVLRLSHVPFDPSYYALKTVSSNLDFVDKSFVDGVSTVDLV